MKNEKIKNKFMVGTGLLALITTLYMQKDVVTLNSATNFFNISQEKPVLSLIDIVILETH